MFEKKQTITTDEKIEEISQKIEVTEVEIPEVVVKTFSSEAPALVIHAPDDPQDALLCDGCQ